MDSYYMVYCSAKSFSSIKVEMYKCWALHAIRLAVVARLVPIALSHGAISMAQLESGFSEHFGMVYGRQM